MSRILPADAQTYSKAPSRYPLGSPTVACGGVGAWIYGTNGGARWEPTWASRRSRWLDTVNGMGAVILGHDWPAVYDAVQTVPSPGMPLPTPWDERAADALFGCLTWPGAESVRFAKNGADVTGAAVRLARAVTGRKRIVRYVGSYHGHHEWAMTLPPWNAGVPQGVRALTDVTVPWLDHDALEAALRPGEVAALIAEPWQVSRPDAPPTAADWARIRDICDETGTLLVLDEVVTGFRMALGGGAEVYGIRPDLACYGKAMGNGYAVAAIVGPYAHLERFERDVFFSTTHGGEGTGLAAACATLAELRRLDVPRRLAEFGQRLLNLGCMGYAQRPVLPGWSVERGACMVERRVLCQGYINVSLALVEDAQARELCVDAVESYIG